MLLIRPIERKYIFIPEVAIANKIKLRSLTGLYGKYVQYLK